MKTNAKLLVLAVLLVTAGFCVGYRVREALPPKEVERNRTPEEAEASRRRSETMMNVQILAQLATIYAHEHGGRLPASLDDLSKMPDAKPEYFRSQLSTDSKDSGLVLYHAGEAISSIDSPTTEPLVSATEVLEDGSRIVAFADGHVDWMSEAAFLRWQLKQMQLANGKPAQP